MQQVRDERVIKFDGQKFACDTALNYPVEVFRANPITSADALCDRLERYSRGHSWNEIIPELDPWQPDVINTGVETPAPMTKRVAAIFNHPSVRRLKGELQLGMAKEVYPGATHNRWSHTLGVFASTVAYYKALLSDPDIPTLRVLLEPEDILHAFVAAILHDLGQVALAHDFEAACSEVFRHEAVITRLIDEKYWGERTLRKVISEYWPSVIIGRVLTILQRTSPIENPIPNAKQHCGKMIDGVAADIINGPIDADKFDYLLRDSIACGVPYGYGIDRNRFLKALSVDVKETSEGCRFALAYRAKGSAAIESLLLARYQMYGAVYWHHTYRSLQAMLTYAIAETFKGFVNNQVKIPGGFVTKKNVKELLYHRVVCGKTWHECKEIIGAKYLPNRLLEDTPSSLANERSIDFIWCFADDRIRKLIECIAEREKYKRVFEIKIGDLGEHGDYSAICAALAPDKQVLLANEMENRFMDAVYKGIVDKASPEETLTESEVKKRYEKLALKELPHVVVDFPLRGIPQERNFPNEISDPARKYLAETLERSSTHRNVFHKVSQLQKEIASFRVYVAPELHELVVRYLLQRDVRAIVEGILPQLKIQS